MVCDPRTLVLGEGNAVTEAAQRGAQKQRFEKFDFVNSKQDMFFCWVPNDISQLRQAAGKAPPVGMMAGAPDGTAEAMAALQNNVIAVAGGGTLSGTYQR